MRRCSSATGTPHDCELRIIHQSLHHATRHTFVKPCTRFCTPSHNQTRPTLRGIHPKVTLIRQGTTAAQPHQQVPPGPLLPHCHYNHSTGTPNRPPSSHNNFYSSTKAFHCLMSCNIYHTSAVQNSAASISAAHPHLLYLLACRQRRTHNLQSTFRGQHSCSRVKGRRPLAWQRYWPVVLLRVPSISLHI